MHIGSVALVVTSSISKISWLSLLEVLRGRVHMYIHRDVYAYVFVSICLVSEKCNCYRRAKVDILLLQW